MISYLDNKGVNTLNTMYIHPFIVPTSLPNPYLTVGKAHAQHSISHFSVRIT